MKKIISVDFDSTLDNQIIQEYVTDLKKRGFDVIVCTSRYKPGYKHQYEVFEWDCSDIYQICEVLNIKKIIFTNMKDKWSSLKDENILFHLDDDPIEILMLNKNNINGILFDDNWKENCEKIINADGI